MIPPDTLGLVGDFCAEARVTEKLKITETITKGIKTVAHARWDCALDGRMWPPHPGSAY
jgi:hypothetical protein